MTIGGAIAELQNLINADDVPFYYKGGIEKVIETILMELPTIEVSEDCISRDWVLNRLTKYQKDYALNELDDWQNTVVEWITTDIENAPSVVPTTEQSCEGGEWQITEAYPHNVYCSECHKKFAQTHWEVWEDGSLPRNYCPNCGAKMKG